jgi:hypothetical protein
MTPALAFTVALAALVAGHQVGDYWVQSDTQAADKGRPGWTGRLACAEHVATYTATQTLSLVLACAVLAVPLSVVHVTAGMALSAATHYLADRREPLRKLAAALGKGPFWDRGGAALLDQAWHYGWIFCAALVIAGRWS